MNIIILIWAIASTVTSIGLFYILWVKTNNYEKFILNQYNFIIDIRVVFQKALKIMKEIDLKNAFEKDDEVGQVFNVYKDIVQKCDNYMQENGVELPQQTKNDSN